MAMPVEDSKSEPGSADQGGKSVSPEKLVREHAGWMLRLAERILNDASLAEDVVQEALINALQGLETFREAASLRTWLHRITINAAISRLRHSQRLAEESIDEYLPAFDQYDCRIEPPWARLLPVHEAVESDLLRRRVVDGIRQLPDTYRVVLQLRDIEGYSTGETAKLLRVSESNVKVRLHRARAALKKVLEPVLRGESEQ